MASTNEKFGDVLRLVQNGIYERFHRDPLVVNFDPSQLKISIEMGHGTEFLTFTIAAKDLEQRSARDIAEGVLNGYGDAQKETDLLRYAKHEFPTADSVSLAPEGAYDPEVFRVVLELKFSGARVLCRFTRELWDHTANFAALQAHMERYRWRDTVNRATTPVTLGETGWIDEASDEAAFEKLVQFVREDPRLNEINVTFEPGRFRLHISGQKPPWHYTVGVERLRQGKLPTLALYIVDKWAEWRGRLRP
jgi:hypothetical protein